MVANKDKKRENPIEAGNLTVSDLVDITMTAMDDILVGDRMEQYARLIFGDDVDLAEMEADTFIEGMSFFRGKSTKLLSELSNSEESFLSAKVMN